MKKAVIQTGSKQYLVQAGERLTVELLKVPDKRFMLEPLLIIDGDMVSVGTPVVPSGKVMVEVVDENVQDDKVSSVRFKAKKRVHKVHGHRQHKTVLKIVSID